MADFTQAPGVKKTYNDDWTQELAKAAKALGLSSLTITSATVTATGGAVVTDTTPTSTGVMFRLDTTGVTNTPVNLTTTTMATLSNGDVDSRTYVAQVTVT